MNVRTLIITAGLTVALVAPAAAYAAPSRTPVHNHAVASEQTSSDLTGRSAQASGQSTVAQLKAKLRTAERRAAKLGAQLRAVRVGNAKLRADLKATKKLVASLRVQLDDALRARNGGSSGGGSGSGGAGGGDAGGGDCTADISYCTTQEDRCNYWGQCDPWPVDPPVTTDPIEANPVMVAESSGSDSSARPAPAQEPTPTETSTSSTDELGYDYSDC